MATRLSFDRFENPHDGLSETGVGSNYQREIEGTDIAIQLDGPDVSDAIHKLPRAFANLSHRAGQL